MHARKTVQQALTEVSRNKLQSRHFALHEHVANGDEPDCCGNHCEREDDQ